MNIEDQMEACIHDYYEKNGAYPVYVTLAPSKARELKEWAARQSGIDEFSPSTFKGVEIRQAQSQLEPMIAHGPDHT